MKKLVRPIMGVVFGAVLLLISTEDDPRPGIVRLFAPQGTDDLVLGIIALLALAVGTFFLLKK